MATYAGTAKDQSPWKPPTSTTLSRGSMEAEQPTPTSLAVAGFATTKKETVVGNQRRTSDKKYSVCNNHG
jgi:hypothetical protein